jgi:hypothetical protein
MKMGQVVAFLIVVAVIALALGTMIGYNISSGKTTSSTSTVCTLSSGTVGVVLRVVQENYSANPPATIPIAGASVTGTDVYYCGNERTQVNFNVSRTNSSGWVSLLFGGFGMYDLNINDGSSLNYTLSVQTVLVTTTYVILNISTGNMTTGNCSSFNQTCTLP